MSYESLTPEQKLAVDNLGVLLRQTCSEIAKHNNHCRAIAEAYSGNVETILGALAVGDVIPNTTGLFAAQPLTKSEFTTLVGYAIVMSDTTDNAVGSYNTNFHRGLYAKACGPVNLNG